MAHTSAIAVVDHTFLVQPEDVSDTIVVGSPAWYAWLADASSFAFLGERGSFTAYKERRGAARAYWKAYRRRAGRLYRIYLGKSSELTLDRLSAVAAALAAGDRPTTRAALQETTQDFIADAERDRLPSLAAAATYTAPLQSSTTSAFLANSSILAADDAQSLHLLATKLAIPSSRPDLVSRPRLAQQIDTAIDQKQKLILISAPAGFGKTTLLTEWLAVRSSALSQAGQTQKTDLGAQSLKVCWLALDDADNHLSQFLAYLIAALETALPGIGAEAWVLLRAMAAQPPAAAILTILLNALADPIGHIVLILDDYHTITLQAIHNTVAFLLDRMPPEMQIIMTTRADPPLPLARLRVRGSLTELRAADLRFTRDEVINLFDHVHGVHLPADAVTTLEARTEGWAAGLQLAALSLQQQDAAQISAFLADFGGSHRYVFDYLADEVFQRQPDSVRVFLMQTAVLGRLCGPLCAAVTGRADAQTMLEQLDRANLFLIRLDSRGQWYRYHYLFRDFLRERLERTIGPDGRALLHRRASMWFEQYGLVDEAIDHALNAQAWEDAMRCLVPVMTDQRFYEYFLDWPRWLAALPDTALQANADLSLGLARILILIGHAEAADRPMDLAEAIWQATSNQPKVGELLSHRALALVMKRDYSRAMQLAQQALDRLPADAAEQRGGASYVLGYSTLSLGHVGHAADLLAATYSALQGTSNMLLLFGTAVGMARAAQLQGQLQRAAALYQDVIRRAGDAPHQQQPAVYFFLGRLYYEWNDLESAECLLQEGIAVGQHTGRGRYWPSAYAALAWVRWARGDVTQTTFMMEQALASARLLDSPPNIAEAETRQAGLWLAQGDLAAAMRWLATRALNIDDEITYKHQAEYLMLVRIRVAQEQQAAGSVDMNAIVRLLDRLLQASEADARLSDRIAILVLTALAHAARRDQHQALARIAAAIELAEPEGYIRTFVDEGAPVCALLETLHVQQPAFGLGERHMIYIGRLLQAFPRIAPATHGPSAAADLLSERERAVLRLLAGGRSVQEIATRLVISAHTARTHVKNIYVKLDAHNRVEALEHARALELL